MSAPKVITLHRAPHADRLHINIVEDITDVRNPSGGLPSMPAIAHMVTYEGDTLADALFETLPRGTLNRLIQRAVQLSNTQPEAS